MIYLFRKEEKKEEPLIIPLLKCNTWHDRIIHKIDVSKSRTSNTMIQNVKIKEESKDVSNDNLIALTTNMTSSPTNVQIKTELSTESKTITLEQVAKEIMEDLKSTEKNKDELCDITLSLVKSQDLNGAEEVSIIFTINYISDVLITFCHTFKSHNIIYYFFFM